MCKNENEDLVCQVVILLDSQNKKRGQPTKNACDITTTVKISSKNEIYHS
jgi:hypothetical protein